MSASLLGIAWLCFAYERWREFRLKPDAQSNRSKIVKRASGRALHFTRFSDPCSCPWLARIGSDGDIQRRDNS